MFERSYNLITGLMPVFVALGERQVKRPPTSTRSPSQSQEFSMDEGYKRALWICAAILADRRLSAIEGRKERSLASGNMQDAISKVERIMRQINTGPVTRSLAEQVMVDLDTRGLKSQLVGEENPMNGNLKWFCDAGFHVDLHDLPSFSFTVNKGALPGNGFLAVHIKVDLFGSRIVVVPKHDLLGGSHTFTPVLRRLRGFRSAELVSSHFRPTRRGAEE
jgi:hypothetical protein